MPKVLFGFFGEWISYPAGILAALAKSSGWDVDFCDFYQETSEADIAQRLDEAKPDLVALSLMTVDRRPAFLAARLARERGIKVVAGGVHASVCPDDLQKSGLFDAIVRGDGMGVFADILAGYSQLDGRVIQGRAHPDISVYYQRHYSESQKERMRRSKMFETMTALGCPMSCTFCATKSKPFIKLPIDAVARQIVEVHKDFGIEDICIRDDMFTLSLERVKTFRKIVQENGLDCEFRLQTRGDHIDDAIVAELKALGVDGVNVGVETTSDKLLKFLNKGSTAEQSYRMAETMARHDMGLSTFLLFGLPTQDQEDYEKTLDFVRRFKPYKMLCHYFLPLPGSALYQYCFDHGHMPAEFSFEDYPYIQPNDPHFKVRGDKPGILENVDYELGARYMEKILGVHHEQADKVIFDAAEAADREGWILVGAGDYFYRVLERLSQRKWKNLLGYYDFEAGDDGRDFLARLHHHSIARYRWRGPAPELRNIVVTKHNGRTFRQVIAPFLKEKKGFQGAIYFAATLGARSQVV